MPWIPLLSTFYYQPISWSGLWFPPNFNGNTLLSPPLNLFPCLLTFLLIYQKIYSILPSLINPHFNLSYEITYIKCSHQTFRWMKLNLQYIPQKINFCISGKYRSRYTCIFSYRCASESAPFYLFIYLINFCLFQAEGVPRLGSNRSCSLWPSPQPWQRQIQAMSTTYTTTHGDARFLTHWARPGIRPGPHVC